MVQDAMTSKDDRIPMPSQRYKRLLGDGFWGVDVIMAGSGNGVQLHFMLITLVLGDETL